MRMLDGGDNPLRVQIGSNTFAPTLATLSSPRNWWMVASGLPTRSAEEPRQTSGSRLRFLKQAFARAAILSNEKFRGVACMSAKTS